jgi:hypothetical protein
LARASKQRLTERVKSIIEEDKKIREEQGKLKKSTAAAREGV